MEKLLLLLVALRGLASRWPGCSAEGGARLALIDINADVLASARDALQETGATIETFVANVADEESVIADVRRLLSTLLASLTG